MAVADFLSPVDALARVDAADKSSLLNDLCRRSASRLGLDGDAIVAEILKREALGSTGIGYGVAIPHARVLARGVPFGMLAQLQRPIEYDAVDGEPVDLVFLLLLPDASAGTQLNALASVARKLRNAESAARLRRATDSAELHRLMIAETDTAS